MPIFMRPTYLTLFFNFYVGFNSTLRQGNITHHEYIQVSCVDAFKFGTHEHHWLRFTDASNLLLSFTRVWGWQCGKGRDVGLNQIAAFEGRVASGNGEQTISRDIYRLGQLFDFFRMCSFFFTSIGFYFTTMVGDLESILVHVWHSVVLYFTP